MFKVLLLQRWYNHSDMAVEEALCDHPSFVRFVGLSLDHDEVPDATPANRSDTEEFVTVLDAVGARAGESVYADKGYSSRLNRYVLQVRSLSDGIMHKAARSRELTLC